MAQGSDKEATMPTIDLFLPPETYPVRRPGRRGAPAPRNQREPVHPFAAAFTLVALWITRAHQRNALAGLDDHMLQDIGITRYDVARECGKPFWR
jgi:uncharacterized protein YjiS (DUF1127 family)